MSIEETIKLAVREAFSEINHPTQVVLMADARSWDVKQCAEYLQVSESHLRNMISQELIPYFRIGGRIQFHPHVIRGWQGTNKVEAKGKGKVEEEGIARKGRGGRV